MNLSLADFAQNKDPEQKKIMVLLIDQAGWHTAKDLVVPENIKLFPLPPYTPELQPVECIWPLLKEVVANTFFESLESLQEALIKRCRWLIRNKEVVKGAVGFGWICSLANQY
jgi:transposase